MSTDLRAALRAAAAEDPFDTHDVHAVVEAGERRVRRRGVLVVGAAALAVAAVAAAAGSLVVVSDRPDRVPRPAHVVTLDIDQAPPRNLDLLGSIRTTWVDEPGAELDGDKFLGLTTDGLALRSRYTYAGNKYELGLFDPVTGRTDWLPTPVQDAVTPVELTADRLVLFGHAAPRRGVVAVFDRTSNTWTSADLRLEGGLEAHVPFRLALAPDDRLYVGSNYEGEQTLHWWSYPLSQGGEGRPEPALADAGVAWSDGMQVTAWGDGRVVVTGEGADRAVAEERPGGCDASIGINAANMPAVVALAGNRPIVTYWCSAEDQTLTVVEDPDSGDIVQIPGASLLAADKNRVLLGGAGGTYLLTLEEDTLVRIARPGQEYEYDLERGLALWNNVGPIDDRDTYDVVWNVARLPGRD